MLDSIGFENAFIGISSPKYGFKCPVRVLDPLPEDRFGYQHHKSDEKMHEFINDNFVPRYKC